MNCPICGKEMIWYEDTLLCPTCDWKVIWVLYDDHKAKKEMNK